MKRTIQPKRSSIGSSVSAADNTMQWISPVSGRAYTLELRELPSEDIKGNFEKLVDNDRSLEHLQGNACVLDILPSITKDKRNSMPGYAVAGTDNKLRMISGLRRMHAVSLVSGASFQFWYTETMSEEDQAALAKNSDRHDRPSSADRVVSLKLKERSLGREVTLDELMEEWGVSLRYARELKRIMHHVPEGLYSLFPALKFIPYAFLQKLLSFNSGDIENVLVKVTALSKNYDHEDSAKAASKSLENFILNKLNAVKPKQHKELPSYLNIEYKKGASVSRAGKGRVKFVVDTSEVSEDDVVAIAEILRKL